jgi:zinc and cadmium transporter
MILLFILGATILNSLLGLAGIFSLWLKQDTLARAIKGLVPFSAGVLLGGAFFHLIAESLIVLPVNLSFGIVMIGFLLFFVLEGYLHWHLCHECDEHPYSYLMIVGDSLHNLIDGIVIAATFCVNIPLGVITTLMILGHELPQELGVFGVLISGGFKKEKAIIFSLIAQTACIAGGLTGFIFSGLSLHFANYMLPLAAGGFIYIAAADLVPSMHEAKGIEKISSFIWLCAGLVFMVAVKYLFNA